MTALCLDKLRDFETANLLERLPYDKYKAFAYKDEVIVHDTVCTTLPILKYRGIMGTSSFILHKMDIYHQFILLLNNIAGS